MQLVLDSNFVRQPLLRDFFAESPDKKVVVADYFGIEAYQSGSLPKLADSFALLCQYSRQVVILKGTQDVCQLDVAPSDAPGMMVDIKASAEFPVWCARLAESVATESPLGNFARHATESAAYLDALRDSVSGLGQDIALVAKELPPSGLRQLRKGQELSMEMAMHMKRDIMIMAKRFFEAHRISRPGTSVVEYGHRFPFRFALVAYLQAIGKVRKGGPIGKAEKLRNDSIDAGLVTYSTYFDGILSRDRGVNTLRATAVHGLERLFGIAVASP